MTRRLRYVPPARPQIPLPGAGSCQHCRDRDALGLVNVAGKVLSLCPTCAGHHARTGALPTRAA